MRLSRRNVTSQSTARQAVFTEHKQSKYAWKPSLGNEITHTMLHQIY